MTIKNTHFFGGIMTQEIEIEYKVLLTKNEYETIASSLPFSTNSVIQVNYYFETKQFDFKKQHSALRIREKNNQYTLTLKQPHKDGILETHDKLTEEEFNNWMNGNPPPTVHVGKQLKNMGIKVERINYFGSLTTKRRSFKLEDILYVLDESTYNGKVDYELEIEAPSKEKGLNVFNKIIQDFHISPKEPITKIERFFYSL